jgi:hypothetical protein
MIEIISPAGFEHFFRELADLISAGPPQAGQVPASPSATACSSGSLRGYRGSSPASD